MDYRDKSGSPLGSGDSGRQHGDESGPSEGDATTIRCFVVKLRFASTRCRTRVFDDYDNAVEMMNYMMAKSNVEDARLWEL